MKICPLGAELFNADRGTDITKLNSRFLQFCKRALRQREGPCKHPLGPCQHPLLFPCTAHCQPKFLVIQQLYREQSTNVLLSFKIGTTKSQQTTLKINYKLIVSLKMSRLPLPINLLKTKCNVLYIRNQSVPRCKHFPPRL